MSTDVEELGRTVQESGGRPRLRCAGLGVLLDQPEEQSSTSPLAWFATSQPDNFVTSLYPRYLRLCCTLREAPNARDRYGTAPPIEPAFGAIRTGS
jgi:hypothetical protein